MAKYVTCTNMWAGKIKMNEGDTIELRPGLTKTVIRKGDAKQRAQDGAGLPKQHVKDGTLLPNNARRTTQDYRTTRAC